jgi:hypothetical protein
MFPETTPMPGGRPVLPPLGWIYAFKQVRRLFRARDRAVAVLSQPLLEELVAVQRQVNFEIRYVRTTARTAKEWLRPKRASATRS